MKCFFSAVLLLAVSIHWTWGEESDSFSLLVYNVENLFDIDGVALYDDYSQSSSENKLPYSPRKLHTKLKNIAAVLKTFNAGKGPEVILFQEFELDRTPESTVSNYAAFLEKYAGSTVAEMLTEPIAEDVWGVPVDAFLVKLLHDAGMTGYHVAKASYEDIEEAPAHTNVVFSKFPVRYQKNHPLRQARSVLEVGLEVEGHLFTVFNVHWKSGASNEKREGIRVDNAKVTRKVVEALLARDANADVVVAGDFNTYYNAKQAFADWEVDAFSIEVVGSQGDELALWENGGALFYNGWFELPNEERRNELWRRQWGTLMQALLTRGLYDFNGIQYIDQSFEVVRLPGLNTNNPWQAPRGWSAWGKSGSGVSDHFPLHMRFRIVDEGRKDKYLRLQSPSRQATPPSEIFELDYRTVDLSGARSADELASLDEEQLANRLGELFRVKGRLVGKGPLKVDVAGRTFELYSYRRSIRSKLSAKPLETQLRFTGELYEYRGRIQFVIHDESWMQ